MKLRRPDILLRLADLHKQATVERSHHYIGKLILEAIHEIAQLRLKLLDCNREKGEK